MQNRGETSQAVPSGTRTVLPDNKEPFRASKVFKEWLAKASVPFGANFLAKGTVAAALLIGSVVGLTTQSSEVQGARIGTAAAAATAVISSAVAAPRPSPALSEPQKTCAPAPSTLAPRLLVETKNSNVELFDHPDDPTRAYLEDKRGARFVIENGDLVPNDDCQFMVYVKSYLSNSRGWINYQFLISVLDKSGNAIFCADGVKERGCPP